MGRRPSKNSNLPPHLRARKQRSGKVYYYYDACETPRREIPLGADYALAVKKWADLEIDARSRHHEIITFRYVAERYSIKELLKKAPATQRGNLRELKKLYEFFDNPPAPIEDIQPIHVRQYLDWRKGSPVRANREKALFSHIWNKAREWGYTDRQNPCAGIKGFTERGRKVYVEDSQYRAVWEQADQPTRDAMDLLYLTGQRPADVLKFSETDIKEGTLSLTQDKTGKRLRMAITGELAVVIDRIMARKRNHQVRSLTLLCNDNGQPLTKDMLRGGFERARTAACISFQMRDLRAKAGTDKAASHDIRAAQKQLGHSTIVMTEHYVRNRKGDSVDPTK